MGTGNLQDLRSLATKPCINSSRLFFPIFTSSLTFCTQRLLSTLFWVNCILYSERITFCTLRLLPSFIWVDVFLYLERITFCTLRLLFSLFWDDLIQNTFSQYSRRVLLSVLRDYYSLYSELILVCTPRGLHSVCWDYYPLLSELTIFCSPRGLHYVLWDYYSLYSEMIWVYSRLFFSILTSSLN